MSCSKRRWRRKPCRLAGAVEDKVAAASREVAIDALSKTELSWCTAGLAGASLPVPRNDAMNSLVLHLKNEGLTEA